MTHDELVARLTAAIDSNDVPPIDGNATAPDEGMAKVLLERLQATYSASSGPVTTTPRGPSLNARIAQWETSIERCYQAFDRSCRALMVIVQEHARRYPDAEEDARGTPIPPELRGQIRNPHVRAWNPGVPIAVPPITSNAGTLPGMIAKHLEISPFSAEFHTYDAAIEAAKECARTFDSARRKPMPVRRRTTQGGAADVRILAYAAAKRNAEAYCQYLDAIPTPPDVP